MNGSVDGPGPRTMQNGHNGQMNGDGRREAMSRAERFEDEKRRIVQSCFSKKDADGSLLESYITHIRITEDSSSPSAPPELTSAPENKKPRIVVIAVRKSGRVRVHKGRENENGSFSIGKTWYLDDLISLESFPGTQTGTPDEEARRRLATPAGLVITLIKPYFWMTGSQKEKEFFFVSITKIYKRYTGGRMPLLIGFDQRELEAVGGVATTTPQGTTPTAESRPSTTERSRSRGPSQGRSLSRDAQVTAAMEAMPNDSPESAARRNRADSAAREPPRSAAPTITVKETSSLRDRERSVGASSFGSRDRIDSYTPASAGVLERRPSHDRFGTSSVPPTSKSSNFPRPKTPEVPKSLFTDPFNTAPMPAERKKSVSSSEHKNSEGRPSTDTTSISTGGMEFKTPNYGGADSRPVSRKSDRSMSVANEHNPMPEPPDSAASHIPTPAQKIALSRSLETPSEPSYTPATARSMDHSAPMNTPTGLETPPLPPDPEPSPETFRPGLGPMIRKKSRQEIASTFKRVATAANAFTPRAGGAGERLQKELAKPNTDADGINGVFPAARTVATPPQEFRSDTPSTSSKDTPRLEQKEEFKPEPKPEKVEPKVEPKVEVKPQEVKAVNGQAATPGPPIPAKDTPKDFRRQKRRSEKTNQYMAALKIDPSLLTTAVADLESLLSEFGWDDDTFSSKKIDVLENSLRREIGKTEAGSWLGHIEQRDDRVEAIERMLDRAIVECDEMDGLLTLYSVELNSLNEDISFIEAQSQGLQVQTANQKLLQTELSNILSTVSISTADLDMLKRSSFDTVTGLMTIEKCLASLYKAMITIDPKLRQESDLMSNESDVASVTSGSTTYAQSDVGSMKALREKKDSYRAETISFLGRFKQFMNTRFQASATQATKAREKQRDSELILRKVAKPALDPAIYQNGRSELIRYSPIMLFAREVDSIEWEGIMRQYTKPTKQLYQEEFRDHIFGWKRIARLPSAEDQEMLFTTVEKEDSGLASTARRLTVKRTSKTVRTSQEPAARHSEQRPADGKVSPWEGFGGALEEMSFIIITEQNFVVDFFHISSIEKQDFAEIVTSSSPESRHLKDLKERKPADPNSAMVRRLTDLMSDIYGFLPAELQSLVEWATKNEPMQAAGVLFTLETKMKNLEDTNQDFLYRTLQKLNDRLKNQFNRFIDEQVRSIEDTKVKINKRRGIISFIRTFPYFCAAMEGMLPKPNANESWEVREIAGEVYNRINNSMFESLKAIAKQNPAIVGSGGNDPEDKEVLNYHILIIENMSYYVEEVDTRSVPTLETWKERATAELDEHMNAYVTAVLRRPLGKLLDFIEGVEALLLAGNSASEISSRQSHSKSTMRKLLSQYDSREIRRGLETLKKRVEKHFGDSSEDGGSGLDYSHDLLQRVMTQVEEAYARIYDRLDSIIANVYNEQGLEIEWRKDELSSTYRKSDNWWG